MCCTYRILRTIYYIAWVTTYYTLHTRHSTIYHILHTKYQTCHELPHTTHYIPVVSRIMSLSSPMSNKVAFFMTPTCYDGLTFHLTLYASENLWLATWLESLSQVSASHMLQLYHNKLMNNLTVYRSVNLQLAWLMHMYYFTNAP